MKSILTTISALIVLASANAFALEVGEKGPCVVLDDIQPNGKVINQCIRTRNKDTSYTLLEFFATTCSDCQENLPNLVKLEADISGTTTIRLVGIDRNPDDVRAYIKAHSDSIKFPVALDLDRDAKKAYGVVSTPTIFILNSKNEIVYKKEDGFKPADLDIIRALVKDSQ